MNSMPSLQERRPNAVATLVGMSFKRQPGLAKAMVDGKAVSRKSHVSFVVDQSSEKVFHSLYGKKGSSAQKTVLSKDKNGFMAQSIQGSIRNLQAEQDSLA